MVFSFVLIYTIIVLLGESALVGRSLMITFVCVCVGGGGGGGGGRGSTPKKQRSNHWCGVDVRK